MTVHNTLTGHDRVSCIWHDCEGRFQEATIDKRALNKAGQIAQVGPDVWAARSQPQLRPTHSAG